MAVRREEIRVDVDVKGDRELDKLAKSADRAKDELSDLGKGMVPYVRGTEGAAKATRKLANETDRLARSERARRQARGEGGRFVGGGGGRGGGARVGLPGISLPINPTTLAIGGVAGAGLSLPLLAGAGGAILGGGGIGAAALGVAGAAANNPAIGRSAMGVLEEQSKRWQRASRAFEEPTLRAIQRLKRAAEDIPLEEILNNAAELVDPLAEGIAGLIEESGKGLGELVEDAGPIIDVLKKELPAVGSSLKVMFAEIGEGSEGGAEALQDILHVIQRMIIGTGKIIHFFEDMYSAGVKLRKALPGDLWGDDETARVQGFSKAIAGTAGGMRDMAGASAAVNEELETYEDILHRLIGVPMDLAEANAQYQASLDNLSESIKDNKRNWDESTEAGRENNRALRDAVNDAIAVRDAQIAMGVQSGVANRQLEDQIGKLRAQAVAAGMSAAEFDRLTGALRNYISTPSFKVITTRFVTEGSAPRSTGPGRQIAFASGGRATPGPILVGDGGKPEWLWLDQPGYVTQVGQTPPGTPTKQMAASAPAAAPSATLTVVGNSNNWLYQAIQYGLRTGQLKIS